MKPSAAPLTRVTGAKPVAVPAGRILQRRCASCGARRSDSAEECAQCKRKRVQPRLRIGSADDRFEHEADRIAESVLAMHAGDTSDAPIGIQRLADAHSDTGDAPSLVDEVLASAGSSLPLDERRYFESRFGHDFSRVRVHTDPRSAASADAIGADAYTSGRDIVFGAGRYAPGTEAGRRLLAHELTHVVQQTGHGPFGATSLQRKPKEPKPKPKGSAPQGGAGKPVAKATATAAPKLELSMSRQEPPCACLMVVHNDERNARKTAQLMHAHCAYNLALVEPDTSNRLITIGSKGKIDPNSLFPRDVAEQCLDDEKSCRDFLTDKASTSDQKELEKRVQIQFFLTVSDCSRQFDLPVVALHNNDIEDTKNYLKDKDSKGVDDLKLDVDKRDEAAGKEQVAELKKRLKDKFGKGVVTETMETAGKTNIFRWCASSDLSRCHIGDPDHPDNVTWVTNEADFKRLEKEPLNVALQSDAPTAKGSESEGDLSTLFVLLKDILDVRLVKAIETIEASRRIDWEAIDKIFEEFAKLEKFHDLTLDRALELLLDALELLIQILISLLAELGVSSKAKSKIARLRYVNIEAPGKALSQQSDAERVRNYEAIVQVLSALGLHCCGNDTKAAETKIKEGLKE